MKKLGILLASLFIMTLATQSVKAQTVVSASANSTAKATIVTAIAIEEVSQLNFGRIFATPEGGKVQIQTNGTRSVLEGNVVLINEGSVHQAAEFKVTGTPSAEYYLDFPTSVSLTGPAGSTAMTVEGFVHSATGTLDDTGKESFNVGATLNVGSNQTPGEYAGTYQVTAVYN